MQPIIFRQSSHISFNNSHALLSHIIICRINRGWYTELYIRRKAVFKWKYIWRTPFPRVVRVFWYISSDIIEYLVIRPNSLHILILRIKHTNPNYSVLHPSFSIPLPCHMIWYDMIRRPRQDPLPNSTGHVTRSAFVWLRTENPDWAKA